MFRELQSHIFFQTNDSNTILLNNDYFRHRVSTYEKMGKILSSSNCLICKISIAGNYDCLEEERNCYCQLHCADHYPDAVTNWKRKKKLFSLIESGETERREIWILQP